MKRTFNTSEQEEGPMKQKIMLIFLVMLMCVTFTIPFINVHADKTVTTNQTGMDGDYFYSFYKEGGGTVSMSLNGSNGYTVNWSNCGYFICGKGWKTGSARNITYTGSFNVSGGGYGYVAVNGWTTNPLVEYYVVENYGSWQPPGGTPVGTVYSDGGIYYVYRTQRVNQLCIIGIGTYYQYWSVRMSKRTSGTITMSNHFNAWANRGWNLGTHNYQILATAGYQSSGSSSITLGSSQ
jgi:endo-1,4-beta-xylanase